MAWCLYWHILIFVIVQKRIAFILLFLFVSHSSIWTELMRLPVLVSHFQEHRQRDCKVSFMDFLSMHYWGNDINDHDEERDQQLPFKTPDAQAAHLSFVFFAKPVVLEREALYADLSYPLQADNHLPDPALSALFRPPRA